MESVDSFGWLLRTSSCHARAGAGPCRCSSLGGGTGPDDVRFELSAMATAGSAEKSSAGLVS